MPKVVEKSSSAIVALEVFELIAVVVFTLEYALRLYAVGEDPRYTGARGKFRYMYVAPL